MKVDEIGQIIEESVRKVASPNEILPFLRLYVENRHLSLTNLLLVYQQDPDIRLVCGEKAWNRMGRNIKENAVSVQLILPEVRPGERENYRMVQGYGIDSTEGKEYRGNLKLPISSEQIMEAAGKDFELVSEDEQDPDLVRMTEICSAFDERSFAENSLGERESLVLSVTQPGEYESFLVGLDGTWGLKPAESRVGCRGIRLIFDREKRSLYLVSKDWMRRKWKG